MHIHLHVLEYVYLIDAVDFEISSLPVVLEA